MRLREGPVDQRGRLVRRGVRGQPQAGQEGQQQDAEGGFAEREKVHAYFQCYCFWGAEARAFWTNAPQYGVGA